MAGGLSDWGATELAGVLFGALDPPAGYWVALVTDEPGPTADGTDLTELEPAGGGYARLYYPSGLDRWAIDGNAVVNLTGLDFGTPTADWGLLSHYALCSAAVAGGVYGHGEFANPVYVAAGFDLVVPAGGLVVVLAAAETESTY